MSNLKDPSWKDIAQMIGITLILGTIGLIVLRIIDWIITLMR